MSHVELIATMGGIAFSTILLIVSFFVKSLYHNVLNLQQQIKTLNDEQKEISQNLQVAFMSIGKLQDTLSQAMDGINSGMRYQNNSSLSSFNPPVPATNGFDLKNNAYAQAAKMIEMGASLEQIMHACQLQPQEAQLIWLMKKKQKVSVMEGL